MNQFRTARKRVDVSVGVSLRIVRELQGLSLSQLAERSGIAQATILAIENDGVHPTLESLEQFPSVSREMAVAVLEQARAALLTDVHPA
jgi:transcriptional regulator with XRE-family HTH domain